jgi:hypothetical protein
MKIIHTYSGPEHRETFWLPDAGEVARLADGAALRTRLDTSLRLLVDVLDAETAADAGDDADDDDKQRPSAAELGAFGY